jgi:hypothetical protein
MADTYTIEVTQILPTPPAPVTIAVSQVMGPAGPTGPTGPQGVPGSGVSVSGTGWVHVTGGSVDGAASTPAYTDVGADAAGAAATALASANTNTSSAIAAITPASIGAEAAGAATTALASANTNTSSAIAAITPASIGAAPTANPTFTGTITRTGVGTPATLPGNSFESYDTIAGTLQDNVQNLSSNGSASSDMVCTADNGTNTTNYVDMGINSSGYNDAAYTSGGPDDAYILAMGGNMAVIAASPGKVVQFYTGGTLAANLRATISDSGLAVVGTVSGSNLSGTNTGDQTLAGFFPDCTVLL